MPTASIKKGLARLQLNLRKARFELSGQANGALILIEDNNDTVKRWESAVNVIKSKAPIDFTILKVSKGKVSSPSLDTINPAEISITGKHKTGLQEKLKPRFVINALTQSDPVTELFIASISSPFKFRSNAEYQKFYNFILHSKENTPLAFLSQFVHLYKTIKQ